jgi:hypothetical protein
MFRQARDRLAARWRARPEVDVVLPDAAPQRVAVKAILAGTVLVIILAVVAQGCTTRTVPFRVERYVQLGERVGPQTLRRELLEAHPPGSPLGGVLSQVTRMGFLCPGIDPGAALECRFRARRPLDGQIATLTVLVAHDGARVEGVEAAMRLDPR